jgi:tetratricopeptide (TPR) repeat protein
MWSAAVGHIGLIVAGGRAWLQRVRCRCRPIRSRTNCPVSGQAPEPSAGDHGDLLGDAMGQRPNELTPHENLHHYWGAELRALRLAQGLSLAELGHRLHCDPSYLAKIERAERPIPATLAVTCDQVLQTQGALVRLHTLTESGKDLTATPGGHASTHVAGEHAHVASPTSNLAEQARFPETGEEIVVPARTPDGRVVFVSVPRRVFLHGLGSTAALGLTATPAGSSPPRVTLPADVNPVAHFQQLRQVLSDNDALFGARRVLPMVRQQLAIMQQLRSSWRGADQRALVRVQAQYTQFQSWLHLDTGENHLAESCVDRALGLAQMAEDRELTAYVFACKAQIAGHTGAGVDAISAAEQALRISAPRSMVAVAAATTAAHGHALGGDHAAMERAYDHARKLFATTDDDPDGLCRSWWLDENRITLARARSLTALGDYHTAAESFQHALQDLSSVLRLPRGRGVWLTRAALASAGDRQVEHAATLGLNALTIGAETRSARILSELAHLDDTLTPWHAVPAVADFRTAMKDTVRPQA